MLRAKKQPTLRVFIKQDVRDAIRTVEPTYTSDGRTLLVMEPTTEKRAGWTIDVTGKIRQDQYGPYVEAYRGSPTPICFDVDAEFTEIPTFNKDQLKTFANLQVFHAAYGKLQELMGALKPLLWVIVFMCIVALAIGIYNAWTISHLPTQYIPVQIPPTQVNP